MTHEDFISLVKRPQSVKAEQMAELKTIIEEYPYFVAPRLMLAYAFKKSNNINTTSFLNVSAIYCAQRDWFYNFVHPETISTKDPVKHERVSKTSGNYFDLINAIESEGGDTKQSLKNMAQKLKEARNMVVKTEVPKHFKSNEISPERSVLKENETVIIDYLLPTESVNSENNVKILIAEKKYAEAIEILRTLNLNNPKKSVYFADQIRFLEKVIANSKK